MSSSITFRGYSLEYCQQQPNGSYQGICIELGVRVKETTLELLEKSFQEKVASLKYIVSFSYRCDQEEYYCTEDYQYGVEDLLQYLPELVEEIEEIESQNTVLNIQISKL